MTRASRADRRGTLDARFRDHLKSSGWLEGAGAVVVGVSGGIDSMVLLHLLRFGGIRGSASLHVAHVDHRMRADSGDDAEWVAKTCADWDVDFHLCTAARPVAGEAEGRDLRYAFFEEVRRGLDGRAVTMTAHTADDQAETVLFRIARGSGPRGLRAIHAARPPSVVRPLLPFWRRELAAFAAEHGVPSRDDPTNLDTRWTRNRLRHAVLPVLEDAVPGAAAALAALADTSRLESAALDELLDERLDALSAAPRAVLPGAAPPLAPPGGKPAAPDQPGSPRPPGPPHRPGSPRHPAAPRARAFDLDLEALRGLSDPVLALLLRRAVARLGGEPSRAATAELLRFVRRSTSGRRLHPTRGVTVEHRLDELRIRRAAPPATPSSAANPASRSPSGPGVEPDARHPPGPGLEPDPDPQPLRIGSGPGQATYARNGWLVEAGWGPASRFRYPHVAHFTPDSVSFPLSLRPWAPGDRVRMSRGTRKVKKVLLEARIPADRRAGIPVVADAEGTVLWIPGVTEPYAGTPAAARKPPVCCVEVRVVEDVSSPAEPPDHADRGGPD